MEDDLQAVFENFNVTRIVLRHDLKCAFLDLATEEDLMVHLFMPRSLSISFLHLDCEVNVHNLHICCCHPTLFEFHKLTLMQSTPKVQAMPLQWLAVHAKSAGTSNHVNVSCVGSIP